MIQLLNIALADIQESPDNPRRYFSEARMADLILSVVSKGILQPILVRPKGLAFEIVAGARRFRAAVEAGLETIPAVVREMDDAAALEAAVIENLQRENVHPIEEAEGYEMLLKKADYNAEQLAEKVGKSRAYIYARLKLLELCPDARASFYEGKLDASTALLVARIPGKVLQKKAIKQICNGFEGAGMSYRTAKDLVRTQFMLRLADANFCPEDGVAIHPVGSCVDCKKRTGNDPDLYADVDDPNVCTDPACYEDKHQQHNANIRARAEKNGILIISGADAQKIMRYSKHDIDGYVALDIQCEDDKDGRTYREILGENAPISALIESKSIIDKRSPLIEVAENKALAAALEKCGFKAMTADEEAALDPEFAERMEKRKADQEKKNEIVKTEKAFRLRLFQAVVNEFGLRFEESFVGGDSLFIDDARALCINILKCYGPDGEDIIDLHMGDVNYKNDEEYQALQTALENKIKSYGLFEIGSFLAGIAFIEELNTSIYGLVDGAQPVRLIAEAERLGLNVETLKNPALTLKPAPKKQTKTKPVNPAAQAPKKVAKKATPVKPKAPPKKTPKPKKPAAKPVKAKAKKAPAKPANLKKTKAKAVAKKP